jgi:probable HAF family extracellular repeat protein
MRTTSLWLGLLLATVLVAHPAAAETYTVVDLHRGLPARESSQGRKINALGQVLFRSGEFFLYDGGQTRDLTAELRALGRYYIRGISDLNEAGQITGSFSYIDETGTVNPESHAYLYDQNGFRDLGTFDGTRSNGFDINALGQVVGSYYKYPHTRPFIFRDGQMQDLGVVPGYDFHYLRINDLGQVAGSLFKGGHSNRAFVHSGAGFIDLGTLGGEIASATSINNLGQVVGYSVTAPLGQSGRNQRAFLWDTAGGMRDLGAWGPSIGTKALDINNRGQVVGTAYDDAARGDDVTWRAVIWENGQMKDLNDLIPRNSGWLLEEASSINDQGQIVGFGRTNARNRDGDLLERAFLLNPRSLRPEEPPQAPAQLAIGSPPSDPLSRLDLTWTDASDTESGFEVERKKGAGAWVAVAQLPMNTTSYSDTGLSAYIRYSYRVRAVNGAGKSAWSNEASGDTGFGPVLLSSVDTLEFGKLSVGRTSTPREVKLTNVGTAPMTISGITITGSAADEFALHSGATPGILRPGESRVVRVTFTPSATGSWLASLTIADDTADGPHKVTLSGAGAGPSLKISVSDLVAGDLEFGPHALGAAGLVRSLLLSNTGSAPLKIAGISVTGAQRQEFVIISGGKSGTLAAGASRVLVVRFTPMGMGRRGASLSIRHNAGAEGNSVSLGGAGVLPSNENGQPAANRPVKALLRINAIDGIAPRGGKSVVSPGQCLTLALHVTFRNGAAAEVTGAPDAMLSATGGRGQFSDKNVWCPQAADAGRTISLVGAYPGLPGKPPIVGRLSVTVRRR